MKKFYFTILIIFLSSSFAFADESICEMNGMTIEGYGLFIGFLSIVCGLVFVLGLNSGVHR